MDVLLLVVGCLFSVVGREMLEIEVEIEVEIEFEFWVWFLEFRIFEC